jgi:hypothetical protein
MALLILGVIRYLLVLGVLNRKRLVELTQHARVASW